MVNLIFAGNVPNIACDALFGASLCALTKKDGGIRPIAVGSSFRKLSAEMAANYGSAFLSEQALLNRHLTTFVRWSRASPA